MPRVELIFDPDCPNIAAAQANLRRACELAGVPADWVEWDRSTPACPDYAQPYGSPTILVDGADVDPGAPMDGAASCRLYRDAQGRILPAPPPEQILAALRGATAHGELVGAPGMHTTANPPARGRWLNSAGALPGVGVALLPACPACWPAYAGVLGAAGFGPLLNVQMQFPLTVALMLLALGTLAYRAPSRRGYGPLGLGVAATAVLLVAKFLLLSMPLTFAGGALLFAAALWNAWPRRAQADEACPACATTEAGANAPA